MAEEKPNPDQNTQAKPEGADAAGQAEKSPQKDKKAPKEKAAPRFCSFHSDIKAITECHSCSVPLCKDCIWKVRGKNTCVNCAQKIRDENKKLPLTFGAWFKGLLISKAFVLIPVALWGLMLFLLAMAGGPKDGASEKVFDYFDRAYPLLGFVIFVAAGFGWKIGAGRARGLTAMIFAAIVSIVTLAVCVFAHFYIYDHFYYPYNNASYRTTTYNNWVKDQYKPWAQEHDWWVRRLYEEGEIETEEEMNERFSTKLEFYQGPMSIEDFKTMHIARYRKWVKELKVLAPLYNEYIKDEPVKKAEWKTIKDRYLDFPKSFGEAKTSLLEYLKNFGFRYKIRSAEVKNFTVVIVISAILWFFGLLYGAFWLPRPPFVPIVPPAAAIKAAAARKAEEARKAQEAGGEQKPGDQG